MKVVINNKFGGFGLSVAGTLKYAELKGIKVYGYTDDRYKSSDHLTREKSFTRIDDFDSMEKDPFMVFWLTVDVGKNPKELPPHDGWLENGREMERHDPALVKTVKLLGKKANGMCADLKIVETPDGVDYVIEEYDGNEHIAEKHRTWA